MSKASKFVGLLLVMVLLVCACKKNNESVKEYSKEMKVDDVLTIKFIEEAIDDSQEYYEYTADIFVNNRLISVPIFQNNDDRVIFSENMAASFYVKKIDKVYIIVSTIAAQIGDHYVAIINENGDVLGEFYKVVSYIDNKNVTIDKFSEYIIYNYHIADDKLIFDNKKLKAEDFLYEYIPLISLENVVGSGYPGGFVFTDIGNFSYYKGEYELNEENSIISYRGTYEVDDTKLILNIQEEEVITSIGSATKKVDRQDIYDIKDVVYGTDDAPYILLNDDIKFYRLSIDYDYLNILIALANEGYDEYFNVLKTYYKD